MNSFDNSIARMKALYTYGQTNENKSQSNSTLEYSAKAADGKTYGIVKECNHFYIKQAVDGKENIAEGYNYIGGYMNKNNYRYDSYNNALKNFELKLASINEAHDAKVDVTTLDPFKKENIIAEASDKMKAEIARQRQIMYNASMIMNESCDYAVKGGKACATSQPEAETGAKGDKVEGSKDAKANPDYKGSHISLEKKAEPFKENPSKSKDLKEGCEGGSCDTDFDEGMNKGQEPATIGWDMEGQEKVNEEGEKEWDKGLPSSAGVGEADTDNNNGPFNKSVNEGAEDELGDDVEGEEDVDLDVNSDVEGEDGIDDVDDFDFDEEDDIDLDGDDLDVDFDEELEGEDELGNEEDVDLEGEEDIDLGADDELGDEPVDESDPESIRSEIERLQSLLNNLEGGEEDVNLEGDVDGDLKGDVDVDVEGDVDGEDIDFEGEEDIDLGADDELGDDTDFDEGVSDEEGSFEGEEDFDDEPMHESKKQFMNRIVESVVRDMLKEDELHDFGKHPGYRKKPMTLPPTGEDKNEHGEDWNDESVHSEEPFGKQIGDSSPFNQLVNAVTKDVMYQLKHGVQLDNKKKAE